MHRRERSCLTRRARGRSCAVHSRRAGDACRGGLDGLIASGATRDTSRCFLIGLIEPRGAGDACCCPHDGRRLVCASVTSNTRSSHGLRLVGADPTRDTRGGHGRPRKGSGCARVASGCSCQRLSEPGGACRTDGGSRIRLDGSLRAREAPTAPLRVLERPCFTSDARCRSSTIGKRPDGARTATRGPESAGIRPAHAAVARP